MYSSSVCPVQATIKGWLIWWSILNFLMAFVDSYPFITGILQSINIRPYEQPVWWACLTISMAFYPLWAESMNWSNCIWVNGMPTYYIIIFSAKILYGSSSTISTFLLGRSYISTSCPNWSSSTKEPASDSRC